MSHGDTAANSDGANKYRDRSTICRQKGETDDRRIEARENLTRTLSNDTGLPYVRHFGVFTLRLSTALPTEIVSREMLTLTAAEYRTLTLISGDSWPINAQIIERKGGGEEVTFELLLSRMN